jgi:hypothetical protein
MDDILIIVTKNGKTSNRLEPCGEDDLRGLAVILGRSHLNTVMVYQEVRPHIRLTHLK